MPEYPHAFGERRRGRLDLPGLPPNLSLDDLARLYRFLDARDLREATRHTALTVDPENPEDEESERMVPFELGSFDPEMEADPLDDEGRMVAKSGEILTSSGHRFHAALILEGGQNFRTFGQWDAVLFLPMFEDDALYDVAVVSEGSEDFADFVARLREQQPVYRDLQVTPYTYRYYDTAAYPLDPHVDDETGWSKNGKDVMDGIVKRLPRAKGSK